MNFNVLFTFIFVRDTSRSTLKSFTRDEFCYTRSHFLSNASTILLTNAIHLKNTSLFWHNDTIQRVHTLMCTLCHCIALLNMLGFWSDKQDSYWNWRSVTRRRPRWTNSVIQPNCLKNTFFLIYYLIIFNSYVAKYCYRFNILYRCIEQTLKMF